MFGHIQANLADLTEDQKRRYQAAYCGLCRTIGKRHGQLAWMGLSYDLTFLSLLLSSLYEPEENDIYCRCAIHPCKVIVFPKSLFSASHVVLSRDE